MITDINSLVSSQGKTSTTQTSSTANLGSLAKLSSELKLIDGLHPIQITSVKNTQSNQGNQQLIGITRSDAQQYTLINDKPSANIQAGDKGTLNVAGNQVTLNISPQRSGQTPNATLYYQTSNQSSTTISTSSTMPSVGSSTTTPPASSIIAPSSSSAGSNPTNNLTSVTSNPNNAQSVATSQISSQQAQTVAQVAIASRPIILTVISSNAETSSTSMPQARPSHAFTSTSASQVASSSAVANNSGQSFSDVSVKQATQQVTTSPSHQVASSAQPASGTSSQTFSAVVSDGDEQFTLNTQHPLKAGDKLTVVIDKQGQVQLYPAERSSASATTLTEGLKQSLPKQITPQEFVSMIRQLNSLVQNGTALPEKVANALDQLVKQLPSLQNLTQSSEGIKQAIQNSGLFSENNLANKTNLTSDLKLNLSRLEGANIESAKLANSSAIQSSNSQQAMNLVAGAIERITTNQVRHLVENAQQDGSILPLSIEIPIKDGQSTSVVNLKIDKDASDKHQDTDPHKRRWLVQLKFDFEETGRFEARASVQGKKVGILFAVEDPNTEQMIRQRLDELRSSLRDKQVEIETLDCFRAKLNEQPNQYQEPTQRRLIDVRT